MLSCTRNGNVVLYKEWKCCCVQGMEMLSCTRNGNVVVYREWKCCPVQGMEMLSCTRNGNVVLYKECLRFATNNTLQSIIKSA